MAKRTGTIIAVVVAMMFCASLGAQQKKSATKNVKPESKSTKDTVAKKKVTKPTVYLGHSEFTGGLITVDEFLDLMKQGVTARDEKGNPLKVLGFSFDYAERMSVEDSVGVLSWQIEYSTEYCKGDTMTSNISENIGRHLKSGDTVYISQVVLEKRIGNTVDTISGKEVKCVIKRK